MGSWKRGIHGALAVARPGNVALTLASVAVGGVCAEARLGWPLGLASLSAALIAAGGYVVNDLFDVEIDRVNRPDRPLPRGDISRGAAGLWAAVLSGCGLAASWTLPWAARCIAATVAAALCAYAAYAKRTLLVGHVLVALLSGTAFVYGGIVGPRPYVAFVPAALAAAFHLGRELFKAAADWRGDSRAGAGTVAVRWGVDRTCRLATVPLLAVVVLSPVPTALGWFGLPYLVVVLGGVDTVLVYAVWRAWKAPDDRTAGRLAAILKWDMVVGLVALGGDKWIR